MAPKFKLPAFDRHTGQAAVPPPQTMAPAVAQAAAAPTAIPTTAPVIEPRGRASLELQILGAVCLLFLTIATYIVFVDNRTATHTAGYLTATAELRALGQQIAKATWAARTGDAASIRELGETRARANAALSLLTNGGDVDGKAIPPTGERGREALDALRSVWAGHERQLAVLIAHEAALRSVAEQPLPDAAIAAAAALLKQTPSLDAAIVRLDHDYRGALDGRGLRTAIATVLGSLALGLIVIMFKVFNDDALARQAETERQRLAADAAREATQAAVRRLAGEMGDLAAGDLTARATVGDDIASPIAESMNYAIGELAVLVQHINAAADRVEGATRDAQATSADLLAASQRQSGEIRDASAQVLALADSLHAVADRASETASVARSSLTVTDTGEAAVAATIAGMNDIRSQIQATAKRIKRLGESSQEIGEIVELISDITEQTNVLSLNAAIQAASAGGAGRGFTIVAEEVQRLAERSAEATRQIAALVKAIQADTHDAVAAMEHSTRGVVEGAQRTDAAGQALAEIRSVANRLAALIEAISTDTREQVVVARRVAGAMQGILQITEETSAGTRQTAGSVGELAALAGELKGSVAGFKV
jgi:twitching motility protein PilJ